MHHCLNGVTIPVVVEDTRIGDPRWPTCRSQDLLQGAVHLTRCANIVPKHVYEVIVELPYNRVFVALRVQVRVHE